jgi:hypothetical protein
MRVQALLASHQQSAPRLDFATAVRSLVAYQHGFAVLSTNSKSTPGFPSGSVVGFAPDEMGRPVFVFSGMSGHTQDVLVDPKCSLTVASGDFKGAADGRVNLMGTMEKIPKTDIEPLKEVRGMDVGGAKKEAGSPRSWKRWRRPSLLVLWLNYSISLAPLSSTSPSTQTPSG